MTRKLLLLKSLLAISLAAGMSSGVQAAPTSEWASSVLGFSSQWSSGSWSATQALGAPNTFAYGDILTSWAPAPVNGSQEYLTLGFATATYSNGATIRETYGNGFVYQIDALDSSNVLHTVWTGSDPSLPGSPVDFSVAWSQTAFLTTGLKIYVDTNHNLSAWEEIDAVQLIGDTTYNGTNVPEPASLALVGLALSGMLLGRRKRSV